MKILKLLLFACATSLAVGCGGSSVEVPADSEEAQGEVREMKTCPFCERRLDGCLDRATTDEAVEKCMSDGLKCNQDHCT